MADLTFPLAIVTAICVWLLLTVIAAGLYRLVAPLRKTRLTLEKMTRRLVAIEQETRPLNEHAEALIRTLGDAAGTTDAAATSLARVNRDLDGAEPVLRRRTTPRGRPVD
jgi:hypothetical protein